MGKWRFPLTRDNRFLKLVMLTKIVKLLLRKARPVFSRANKMIFSNHNIAVISSSYDVLNWSLAWCLSEFISEINQTELLQTMHSVTVHDSALFCQKSELCTFKTADDPLSKRLTLLLMPLRSRCIQGFCSNINQFTHFQIFGLQISVTQHWHEEIWTS